MGRVGSSLDEKERNESGRDQVETGLLHTFTGYTVPLQESQGLQG